MRVPIGISNRHVHLSQADVERLFGKWYQLQKLRNISQPWQFACQETVTLQWPRWNIENVRVVWPVRKISQVEIMLWDNYILWINAPVQISGEVKKSDWIRIIWPNWIGFDLSSWVIVSKRHLHCTVDEAKKFWLQNGDLIKIQIWGERGLIFENVAVRARDDYALDFHIDIEEANAAGVKVWDRGEILGMIN